MTTTATVTRVTVPYLKSTKPFTPAQFGDRPELSARAEREALQQSHRMRRWWVAYEMTCNAHGLAIGTVMVPCMVCGHSVDAWRADVDHVTGRQNGSHANVGLTHAACNRQVKADAAPTATHVALVARVAHLTTYPRVGTPEFRWLWIGVERAESAGRSIRRTGNGDDYVA